MSFGIELCLLREEEGRKQISSKTFIAWLTRGFLDEQYFKKENTFVSNMKVLIFSTDQYEPRKVIKIKKWSSNRRKGEMFIQVHLHCQESRHYKNEKQFNSSSQISYWCFRSKQLVTVPAAGASGESRKPPYPGHMG